MKYLMIILLFFMVGCGMSRKEVMDASDECISRKRIAVYVKEGMFNKIVDVQCWSFQEFERWGLKK